MLNTGVLHRFFIVFPPQVVGALVLPSRSPVSQRSVLWTRGEALQRRRPRPRWNAQDEVYWGNRRVSMVLIEPRHDLFGTGIGCGSQKDLPKLTTPGRSQPQKWPSHGVPTGVPKMGPRSFSEVQQGEGDSRMEYVSWTKNKTPPITGRSTGRICQGSSPSIRCGAECFFPFQQSHPSRSISCRESCFSLGSCPAV